MSAASPTRDTNDKEWVRQRFYDTSIANRDDMQDVYHPTVVTQDEQGSMSRSTGSDVSIINAGPARGGGWVYHRLIEPGSDYPNAQWGPGVDIVDFFPATNAEAADVFTSWQDPKQPPYAKGGTYSIRSWAIPYSSLSHYFSDHLQSPMEYKLVGAWDNTVPFGHESDLFKALYGEF